MNFEHLIKAALFKSLLTEPSTPKVKELIYQILKIKLKKLTPWILILKLSKTVKNVTLNPDLV